MRHYNKPSLLALSSKNKAMQQVVINVENPSILPSLRRVLNAMEGVSIVPMPRRRRSGIEEAEEDIRKGRVYKAASVDDMFEQILGA